jgi:hypothetical protein
MSIARRTTPVVVVALSLLIVGHQQVMAGTFPSTNPVPAAQATEKPPPDAGKKPPKTTGKLKSWGTTLESTQKKRFGSPEPKKTTKPKGQQDRTRNIEQSEEVVDQPVRFKSRPCGLPTHEMLTGGEVCKPDLPDEEEVQPTPSMAVRTRLPMPEDVTWEQVLNESKNVAFPGLRVNVQPAERTLVNLDTIVYTDQSKVSETTVELLGFPVAVEATPMSYTWNFGDGTSVTTESPGKPYPAKEITHKYLKRGSVSITLTTHYAARFNVAETGWQYISGTVPITGPATVLQVREAVPVLVDPPN